MWRVCGLHCIAQIAASGVARAAAERLVGLDIGITSRFGLSRNDSACGILKNIRWLLCAKIVCPRRPHLSHGSITVRVQVILCRPAEGNRQERRLAQMSFVDLAGSERAARTGNIGARLK